MQKKKAVNKRKTNRKQPVVKKKTSVTTSFSRIILFILIVFIAIAVHPTVIFLFFAMLPTIVAFMLEKNKHQYKWYCIGFFNVSGTFYYLLNLWYGSNTLEEALSILLDVTALIIIYGSACFGILVYIIFPIIVVTIMQLAAYRRVNHLKNVQQRLIENWGDEVKTIETN